jgi:reactive intermediate/imine deaminase
LSSYFGQRIDDDVVGYDLRDLVMTKDTQVHLIWGAQDKAVPIEIGLAASRMLGGLPLRQVANTGHAPYFEDPVAFTEGIGEMLGWSLGDAHTVRRDAAGMRRREIEVEGLNEPISHYVDAVRFGDLLFVSGCAPVDADLQLVGGDDAALQCRQIFENIKKCLGAVGLTFDNVLRVTVYLTDIDDRRVINPVRQEFFGSARPASTLIEVSKLALPGMKVEIEAIAGFETS